MIEVSIESVLKDGIAVSASLEALDAAVLIYLVDRFGDQVRDFWRQPRRAQALQVYTLRDESGWTRLGNLGELHLRGVGVQQANLRAIPAGTPFRWETLFYLYGGLIPQGGRENMQVLAESHLRQAAIQQLQAANPSFDAWFGQPQIETAVLQIIAQAQEKLQESRLAYLRKLISDILDHLQMDGLITQAQPESSAAAAPGALAVPAGNPGLSREEQIYRLALAIWAEELRQQDPQSPWKEIARKIGWPYHPKLLADARQRLARARKAQNDLYTAARQLAEQLKHKS